MLAQPGQNSVSSLVEPARCSRSCPSSPASTRARAMTSSSRREGRLEADARLVSRERRNAVLV